MDHNYSFLGVQLNSQDLCHSSTRVTSYGFIANYGFPQSLSGLHNSSCLLQPQSSTPGGVPVTVGVMYANLPEPQEGAEELWIEDQVRRFTDHVKHFNQSRDGITSLRPSDTIWRHRSGSTLAHVMACCLTAPSHYLNQCWLITSKV